MFSLLNVLFCYLIKNDCVIALQVHWNNAALEVKIWQRLHSGGQAEIAEYPRGTGSAGGKVAEPLTGQL